MIIVLSRRSNNSYIASPRIGLINTPLDVVHVQITITLQQSLGKQITQEPFVRELLLSFTGRKKFGRTDQLARNCVFVAQTFAARSLWARLPPIPSDAVYCFSVTVCHGCPGDDLKLPHCTHRVMALITFSC